MKRLVFISFLAFAVQAEAFSPWFYEAPRYVQDEDGPKVKKRRGIYPEGFQEIIDLGQKLRKNPRFDEELGHLWSFLTRILRDDPDKLVFEEMTQGYSESLPASYSEEDKKIKMNPELLKLPPILGLESLIHELQHAYDNEIVRRNWLYTYAGEARGIKAGAIVVDIYGEKSLEELQYALPDAYEIQMDRLKAFKDGDKALLDWTRKLYDKYTGPSSPRLLTMEEAYKRAEELQNKTDKDLGKAIQNAKDRLVEYLESSEGSPQPARYRGLEYNIRAAERDLALKKEFSKLSLERRVKRPLELDITE